MVEAGRLYERLTDTCLGVVSDAEPLVTVSLAVNGTFRSRGERVLYTSGMTKAEIQRQVMELPEEERLEIADAIWTSLPEPDSIPLPAWQRDLLDERLASADTEEGRDWEDVKADIWPETR